MKYLKQSDTELLARIEREPALLRLPFIRCANKLSIGNDQEAWKGMIA
jgi:arsenate reductase-like glutaredoxin family protein